MHSLLLGPNAQIPDAQAVAKGEGDGVLGLRENTIKIMCHKMLLDRSQGRATANL